MNLKKKFYNSHVMLICFATKSRDFVEILKVKTYVFFKSVLVKWSKNTGPVTRDNVKGTLMQI